MTELLTQYGPYVFVVLAAFFLFAAGHHVGSNTAATSAKEPAKTGIDAEVAKAHDALDKAGVFGANRLIAIAAVRAGQVTGDDVARAHPVAQKMSQAELIAKAAE